MFRRYRKLVGLAALAAVAMLMLSVPVFAFDVNQHYTNTTGHTAYSLVKILPGQFLFTEVMLNQPFASFDTMSWGGCTLAHWYNGTVDDNEQGHACFATNKQPAQAFATYWIDQAGQFLGAAGPIMGVTVSYNPATGETVFKIDNEWKTWIGNTYPPTGGDGLGAYVGSVQVTEAKFGVVDSVFRPIAELDSGIIGAVSWASLNDLNTSVPAGGSVQQTINTGMYPPTCAIVFRFNAANGGNESFYVCQKTCTYDSVPSLTSWGLAVLVVLLILSAATTIYRRRRRIA